MDVTRFELDFPSSGGGHDIFACIWRDTDFKSYKAVIQLVHGMAEHILRYEEFAVYLAKRGYVVCGNDHMGHGNSVEDESDFGYFGKRENSWHNLIDDMNYLEGMMRLEYPDIPYFMLGHSMGSFLAREYTSLYGTGFNGAVFMGIGYTNPLLDFGIFVSKRMAAKHPKQKGELVDRIAFGAFNNKLDTKRTKYDWISTDKNIVDKYIKDEKCGFLFTNEGYRDLFLLLKHVNTDEWAKSLPSNLPMLLISGSDDPVGDYGKDIKKVYKLMLKGGCVNVDIKLLHGARHEVLNDLKRDKVYSILYNWFEKNI
ncbi:MAG: alpha/beta hydrolase [Clostridiales bacterium]|nr:alpha/beta hydrolase [Clostridiales bacterium]